MVEKDVGWFSHVQRSPLLTGILGFALVVAGFGVRREFTALGVLLVLTGAGIVVGAVRQQLRR